jgi:hypothetical protein
LDELIRPEHMINEIIWAYPAFTDPPGVQSQA